MANELIQIQQDQKPDNGVIWVNRFDEYEARSVCQQLLQISAADPTVPITVYIDSYGGAVDSLAAMISTIESIPNTIVTVCVGKAMSCGAMLLSCGDYRYVGPHARVMVHEVSAGALGHVSDIKVDTQEIERLNGHWMNWLAKNCGLRSYKHLKSKMRSMLPQDGRDLFLTPQEAVKFGIADAIGIPKILRQNSYEIATVPEMSRLTALAAAGKGKKRAK